MNKIFSRPYHPQDPQFLPQMRAYGRSSPSMRTKPPSPSSLIALGPRWLAYPGKKVQSIKDEDPTSNTMDQLVEAAKYLSDVGYKTMSSYFSPESQPTGPAAPALTPEDLANFGNVRCLSSSPLRRCSLRAVLTLAWCVTGDRARCVHGQDRRSFPGTQRTAVVSGVRPERHPVGDGRSRRLRVQHLPDTSVVGCSARERFASVRAPPLSVSVDGVTN